MTTTRTVPAVGDLEAAIGSPMKDWAHDCHGVSVAIVRSGVLPGGRVARGWCAGVSSQHSWVIVGDCYDEDALIIDATLWSYDPKVPGLWIGTYRDGRHRPHGGDGDIWASGRPTLGPGDPIALTPSEPLSDEALRFLGLLGPLDRQGWSSLARGSVRGWPSSEIIAAMDDTVEIKALVPIDILGMVTDRNPGGLYLSAATFEFSPPAPAPEILVATHVECCECRHRTEVGQRDPDDVCCEVCDDGDHDPWLVMAVAVFPCPHGVTARDWIPGGYVGDKYCDDENHEPRSGLHVVTLADQ